MKHSQIFSFFFFAVHSISSLGSERSGLNDMFSDHVAKSYGKRRIWLRHESISRRVFKSFAFQFSPNLSEWKVFSVQQSSGPQPFWHQGSVLQKCFHGPGDGKFIRMIQVHYINCTLYFYYYYISSSSDHQALDLTLRLGTPT